MEYKLPDRPAGFFREGGKVKPRHVKKGIHETDLSIKEKGAGEKIEVKIDPEKKKQSGVKTDKKEKNSALPEAYSPEWDELKRHVENQFDKDFTSVKFENLKKIEPNWFEYVDYKEPTKDDLIDYFGGKDAFKDATEDEIEEAKDSLRHEQEEIIWGTLFEAGNQSVVDKIKENKEKIQELGLTIIDLGNSEASDNYDTGVFLGVRSAGHDFYESYWVPLWKIFGWLPDKR